MTRALKLDSNEGPLPPRPLVASLAGLDPERLRRYPDAGPLEKALAERLGVTAERVVVTAGADEAIDRALRARLQRGRTLLLPEPTFEMFDRFAALAGAALVRVPWPRRPFPLEGFLSRLDARTGVVAVVSPNNPTGAVATAADVRQVAAAARDALVLLDHVYVEYADEDLTGQVLDLPNVVVVRTLSKAWGLAGCRIGYAAGAAAIVEELRAAGGPYPVAAPSIALARARLEAGDTGLREHVSCVVRERAMLARRLGALGLEPLPSQANFVLVECGDRAPFIAAALAALGVLVRGFPGRAGLATSLRISLPGETEAFGRLTTALETTLEPQALLMDLDGVVADVSESQHTAIAATASSFGAPVEAAEVAAVLRAGDAANDWVVTQRLIAGAGQVAALTDVVSRYQSFYLGDATTPGMRERERLIPPRALLERLASRLPLAIVTGRPRAEAQWFLERTGIAGLFAAVVAMEDAPAKPDPAPLRLALERLGVSRAWMIGDTPDDSRAAARAGVLPLGVLPPGAGPEPTGAALRAAGAARVLDRLAQLPELLP